MKSKIFFQIAIMITYLGVSGSVQAAALERFIMPGPVSAAHAELEDQCSNCHSPLLDQAQEGLCVACHEDVGKDIATSKGFHGRHADVATNECQICHTEHEGRDAETLTFDLLQFDHTNTDFPLHWTHATSACESCHEPNVAYSAAPNTCIGCHQSDDPHDAALGMVCDNCHTAENWQETRFDHSQTKFALLGQHSLLSCSSCHSNNQFAGTATECIDCHKSEDVHQGKLGSQCQQCHNATTWTREVFDHSKSGFPLSNGHANLSCDTCHTSLPLTNLRGSTCLSCHAGDDIHEGNNGSMCASCHGTTTWTSPVFDHLIRTGFRLNGAHSELSCSSCHSGALTAPVASQCNDCHAQDDPHAGQLGSQCANCHTETSWHSGIRFDHDLTKFPLIGEHGPLVCASCHQSLTFRVPTSECSDCHAQDDVHQNTLGNQCQSCHSPVGWQLTTFDHEKTTHFALDPVHNRLECAACHTKPVFLAAPAPNACVTCHRKDDPHQGRFGSDCGRCHQSDTFTEIERF